MITIHFDFTDGTELSYVEGLHKKDDFTTTCLEFFSMDTTAEDVVVLNKDGLKISRNNIQKHTTKKMRNEHDIRKLLVGGAFYWL